MDVMRQALLIALLILVSGPSAMSLAALEPSSEPLDQARTLLARGEYQKAATLLEDELASSPPAARGEVLAMLRGTYKELIRAAEASGKASLAAEYRDNLAILEPSLAPPDATPAATPAPVPRPSVPPPFTGSLPAPRDPRPALPAPRDPRPALPVPAPKPLEPLPLPLRAVPRASSEPEPGAFKEPDPLPEPAGLPPLDGPGRPAAPAPGAAPPARGIPPRDDQATRAASTVANRDSVASMSGSGTPASGQPQLMPEDHGAPARGTGPSPRLAQADAWFSTKKYAEAGQAYASLAAQNQLPPQRKAVWAYCRWVAVVSQINAHPRTNQEWDEIEREVQSIQRLTPGNWYGEYLLNRIAEARKATRGSSRGGKLVVRGSAPEEDPPSRFPRLLGRSRPAQAASPQPAAPSAAAPSAVAEPALSLPVASGEETAQPLASAAPPETEASAGPANPSSNEPKATPAEAPREAPAGAEARGPEEPGGSPLPLSWQVRETRSFRVHSTDPALAAKAAEAAEGIRTLQGKRWGSPASRVVWSPRCDIYLYATARDFTRMTGQPESSPGFSTMSLSGNKIIGRRINLRADHPQLLSAVLPHEVTHVVLADLFTERQIPRWADEGMAVLSEPRAEQESRAAELTEPLREGRVFKLSELMAMDYPSSDAHNLFFAQSVSVTQFLVAQGTPEQFVGFVRGAQRKGVEAALRESYHFDSFAELENRWQTYARRQAADFQTSSREPAASDLVRRQ